MTPEITEVTTIAPYSEFNNSNTNISINNNNKNLIPTKNMKKFVSEKVSPVSAKKFSRKMDKLQENESEMLYYEFDVRFKLRKKIFFCYNLGQNRYKIFKLYILLKSNF